MHFCAIVYLADMTFMGILFNSRHMNLYEQNCGGVVPVVLKKQFSKVNSDGNVHYKDYLVQIKIIEIVRFKEK